MTFIALWIRRIAIVMILAGIVELIMPRGGLKPYVRLVLGLLVMLILLEPVQHFLVDGPVLANLPDITQYPDVDINMTLPDSERLQQRTEALTMEVYRERLEEEIRRVASRVDALEVVEAAVAVEANTNSKEYGVIQSVALMVRRSGSTIAKVEEIEPISPQASKDGEEIAEEPEWPAELAPARSELLDLLRLHFNIHQEQVRLTLISD